MRTRATFKRWPPFAMSMLCVVWLLAGCSDLEKVLFTPRVKVRCQILRNSCTFTNYGDPGEACVRVEVFHMASGRTLKSEPVCSGRIDRNAPAVVPVVFPKGNPTQLCMGEDLKQSFKKQCEVTIEEFDD